MVHISRPHIQDFIALHDVAPSQGHTTLWGFGQAPILFASPDGTRWWTQLETLAEPSGIAVAVLTIAYNDELEADTGHADRLPIEGPTGVRDLRLVDQHFVQAVFEHLSPWSETLRVNHEAGEPNAGTAGALRLLDRPD